MVLAADPGARRPAWRRHDSFTSSRERGEPVPPACAGSWRAHRFAGFALAGLAFAAAPVRAQDAQAELPQVEIVAEKPEGSLRAPAAEATVVEARRFAGEVRSVAELLGTSPGVSLHALGGPGQATTLSLRGASADQSLVLLDGIPLQGPGGGSVDLATLPATLLDRIVVSRGVLGAQFGAGALGGGVELVPRATAAPGGGTQLSAGSAATAQLSADVEIGDGGGSGLA